jgi:hypothetical protein
VTDIFLSYSSVDRERVRPIRDALVAQGFEVFWDQQVPTGLDWDTWIRQHLAKSKCAVAFWSAASVASRNVRHEATIADQQGKLIPVLLEPLTAQQFPMGLYAHQAANLAGWNGDLNHDEWCKLRREYEAKLMPSWVRQRMDEKDAELVAERARRQGAERRDKTLQAQIAKEAETQQELRRERDGALDEVAALKAMVEELTRARSEAEAKQTGAFDEIAALKATVEEVTRARSDAEARVVDLSRRLSHIRQTKAKEIARYIGATLSPLVIAAAVVTVGFWTYQLIWSAPQPLPAVTSDSTPEAEQQRLAAIKEEEQRQAKAVADVEAKLEAAEAEQQRLRDDLRSQTKAAGDADSKRRAVEAEQQPLKDELQRQIKAAADADSKRKTAEAEQQRLKDDVQRQTKAAADADARRRAAEAEQQRLKDEIKRQANAVADADARRKDAEAEQQRLAAQMEEERKATAAAPSASSAATLSITRLFSMRLNTEVFGSPSYSARARSVNECAESCARVPTCATFSYNKASGTCYTFSDSYTYFSRNEAFDSGERLTERLPFK